MQDVAGMTALLFLQLSEPFKAGISNWFVFEGRSDSKDL
jgi:hypothetical protein